MPIILITIGYEQPSTRLLAVRDTYGIAIAKAGGTPLYAGPDGDVETMAACGDGLLLSGGDDCDSRLFGVAPIAASKAPDRPRDAMELACIRAFHKAKKPIFGICRGMQMVNIALGGTIYQDIHVERATIRNHYQKEPYDHTYHKVKASSNSLLKTWWQGEDDQAVNSVHHQAVHIVAPPLRPAAISEDGLIEAVEGENIFCCQWHPEWLIHLPAQQTLFDHFIRATR